MEKLKIRFEDKEMAKSFLPVVWNKAEKAWFLTKSLSSLSAEQRDVIAFLERSAGDVDKSEKF